MLDKLVVKKHRVDYYFTPSEKIKKYFNHDKMFVEYDIDISDIPVSILVIPFVANILPLMWLIDGILWVTDIDRTFYDAIPRIKYAYQELYPHYKLKGTVVPAYTTENTFVPEREAILLFGGGVDSNATFIKIKHKTPILVNVQGWYEAEILDNAVYNADKRDITKFALTNNLDSHFVRSNFVNVINISAFNNNIMKKLKFSYWLGFQHSMAFISISSILAYEFKVKNIYIASSATLGYRRACASDPTTDIQFKFASRGNTIHDGFELNRQDKIKIIVAHQKVTNINYPIRVCSFNDQNCCACEKCFRTIAGIVAEGGDVSKFSFLIDNNLVDHFEKVMDKIIIDINDHKEQLFREAIKRRMLCNRDAIFDQNFVEWFLNYDIHKKRNQVIHEYRKRNFFSIIKRKISNIFH